MSLDLCSIVLFSLAVFERIIVLSFCYGMDLLLMLLKRYVIIDEFKTYLSVCL